MASRKKPFSELRKLYERQLKALAKAKEKKWGPLSSGKFNGIGEPRCVLCAAVDDDCKACILGLVTGEPCGSEGDAYYLWEEQESELLEKYYRANTDCNYRKQYRTAVNDPKVVARAEVVYDLLTECERVLKGFLKVLK